MWLFKNNLNYRKISLILVIFILFGCSLSNQRSEKNNLPSQNKLEEKEIISDDSIEQLNQSNLNSQNEKYPFSAGTSVIENVQENLVPFFVFYTDRLFIIDLEYKKISSNYIYNLNDKFATFYGSSNVNNILDLTNFTDLPIENCGTLDYHFVIDHYSVVTCSFDCPPDQNKIQIWDISNNTLHGEIHVGWDEYCSYYYSLVYAPDQNRFLLSGRSSYARMFSINPLQEIQYSYDDNLVEQLTSSPDKKFIVSDRRALWKWNDDGVEFIEAVSPPRRPNILSVSNNAEFMAYEYQGENFIDFVTVLNSSTRNEIFRISQDDLMYGGFVPEYSALSPDGKLLFISGYSTQTQDHDFYVIQIDTSTGEFIHNFGPFLGANPWRLRIEYLPESIRSNWEWESY